MLKSAPLIPSLVLDRFCGSIWEVFDFRGTGLLFENFFLSDLWLQKDQSADHQANSTGSFWCQFQKHQTILRLEVCRKKNETTFRF